MHSLVCLKLMRSEPRAHRIVCPAYKDRASQGIKDKFSSESVPAAQVPAEGNVPAVSNPGYTTQVQCPAKHLTHHI